MFAGLSRPAFFMECPTEPIVGRCPLRLQSQHALPARDGFGKFLAFFMQFGQVFPESGIAWVQLDCLLQPGQASPSLPSSCNTNPRCA